MSTINDGGPARAMSLEEAVVELVKAQDAVKCLTKQIVAAMDESINAQVSAESGNPYEPVDWLKLAWAMEWEPADCGYGRQRYFVNHDDDVLGYLEQNCPHALRAHLLIQDRKAARRVLGAAKRRVSVMGRALLKKAARHAPALG